ncbi:MAG TPA: cellulase family glycosylhydrolase [Solirubrobacteraceae bacterium]|nr:cellulase family glycosylhydrolase [Solirubrobacteraceae bacterium]
MLALTRPLRLLAVCALTIAASFLLLRSAPPAHAESDYTSIMMDDNNLVYGSTATSNATLTQMKALGVQYVRVTVLWANLADGMQAYDRKHHIAFNQANPAAYPPLNWNRYDNIVQTASRLGLGVYFDVTGPGPSYTHAKPPKSLRADVADTYEPNVKMFYEFVAAVGKRYSGSYRKGRITLPRVSTWSLWNEPNQGGWLTPQWKKVGGQLIPWSPVMYRELYINGWLALQNTGHAKDHIFIGETSPLGVTRRTQTSEIDPTTFIRETFCVTSSYVPYTGSAASARDCGIFDQYPTLYATAWAHHPYTKTTPPTEVESNPNDITMANLDQVHTLLYAIGNATHRVNPNLPIISTEFGYQTNPPSPYFGVSLADQEQWNNEGDFLAYFDPDVIGQTQFLLKDVPPDRAFPKGSRGYWSTYQSGLEYTNGTPKPSYTAYQLPFVVAPSTPNPTTGQPQMFVWGQLRFMDNLSLPPTFEFAQVQFEPTGSSTWTSVGSLIPILNTFNHGFFGTVPVPGAGQVRLFWSGGGRMGNKVSRAIAVTAAGVSAIN